MKKRSKYRMNVLTVCGAGVVTSAMLTVRLQDIFDDQGISCVTDTTTPSGLERILESRKVDLIITTTPLTEMKGITCPVINGHSLLSGKGEEETIEEIIKIGNMIIEKWEKENK